MPYKRIVGLEDAQNRRNYPQNAIVYILIFGKSVKEPDFSLSVKKITAHHTILPCRWSVYNKTTQIQNIKTVWGNHTDKRIYWILLRLEYISKHSDISSKNSPYESIKYLVYNPNYIFTCQFLTIQNIKSQNNLFISIQSWNYNYIIISFKAHEKINHVQPQISYHMK